MASREAHIPSARSPDGEVTRLLRAWQEGSPEAREQLWRLLYDELKGLARGILHRGGRGGRSDPTSLVHKAYLRLMDAEVDWSDRGHFFAVAARAMRFVLVDEARRQLSKKRGEQNVRAIAEADLAEIADPLDRRPEEILAVHQALARLGDLRPRHEKLVELRYFAGLSVEETAEILAVDPRTVVRDWKAARTWLHGELGRPG